MLRIADNTTFALTLLFVCASMMGCGPTVDIDSLPPEPELFMDSMPSAAAEHVSELKAELDARPTSAPRNGNLGMALQAYGFDSQASVYYQRAHLLDPKEFRWAFYLGMTMERTGHAQDALAAYLAANSAAPEQPTVRRKLAEQLVALNRLDDSERIFLESLEAAPGDVQTLISFGRLRLRQQRFAEAREIFAQVLALGDPSAQAYQGLATAARGLGDDKAADRNMRLYEKNKNQYAFADPLITAIGKMNRSNFYHQQRARQFLARNNPMAAIQEYQAALKKEPNNIATRATLIQLFSGQGDLQSAREIFEEGKVLTPGAAALYLSFGLAEAVAGNNAGALKHLRKSVQLEPRNTVAILQLGLVLEKDKQLEQAERQYRAVLRIDADNAQAHYLLGRLQFTRREFDSARASFLHASNDTGEHAPRYLQALARTQIELGNYAAAEQSLNAAISLSAKHHDEAQRRQLLADLERVSALKSRAVSR